MPTEAQQLKRRHEGPRFLGDGQDPMVMWGLYWVYMRFIRVYMGLNGMYLGLYGFIQDLLWVNMGFIWVNVGFICFFFMD